MGDIGEIKAGVVLEKQEFAVSETQGRAETSALAHQGQVDLFVPKLDVEASLHTTIARPRWGSSIWASSYAGFNAGVSGSRDGSQQSFAAEVTGRIGTDFLYQNMDAKYGDGFYAGGGSFIQGGYQSAKLKDTSTGESRTGQDWKGYVGLRGVAGYHTEDRGSGYWMFEGAVGLVTQIDTMENTPFANLRMGHSF